MNPTDVMSLRRLSLSPALGSFEEVGGRGGERATKYSQEYATSGHGRRPGLVAFLPKRKDPRSLRRGVVVGTIERRRSVRTNPDNGHTGAVTPVRTYQASSGGDCREYETTVTVGGKLERGYGTACRQPDGSWHVAN